MKKTINQILKNLFILGVITLSSVVLVACGKTHLKTEDNIKEQMFLKEEFMLENVYGKEGTLDFNLPESDNYVENSDYFVKVATNIKEDIPKIKLGHVVYLKTDKAITKVSSVNTLIKNAFFVEEKTLYISNVLMFLNTSNDGILRIDFPQNKFMQITVDVFEDDENNLDLKVVQMTENTLHIINEENLKFRFEIDNPNGKLFFSLSENEQELENTAPILLQTVANPEKNNQSFASRFETPSTVTQEDSSGIEVSPGYNEGQAYTSSTPANHTLIYNVYVPQVGVKVVMLEFKNTKTS